MTTRPTDRPEPAPTTAHALRLTQPPTERTLLEKCEAWRAASRIANGGWASDPGREEEEADRAWRELDAAIRSTETRDLARILFRLAAALEILDRYETAAEDLG